MKMFTDQLKGAVALLTGGASGLGEATAHRLAEAGATVVLLDRREGEATDVVHAIRENDGSADSYGCELLDEASIQRAVARCVDVYDAPDILINNAGTDITAPIPEISVEQWDAVVGVNLRAPFLLSRALLPLMAARGSGHIVNIASTAAKRAWPNASAYHASKWGLLGFTHALHTEARPHGVKVTALIAGGMRTPFLLERFPDIEVGTLQDPANVAEAILFTLLQPEGTVIPEVMVLPMRETSWP